MRNLFSSIHVRYFVIVTAVLITAGPAGAVVIVDTGPPSGVGGGSLYQDSTSYQFLGGRFTVGSSQLITQIEGWIDTTTPGNVVVSLWSGAPSITSTPLFTSTRALAIAPQGWQAFSGISWTVAPGTYSITFSPLLGYFGNMRGGAPTPLQEYYFNNANAGSLGNWIVLVPVPANSFGLRITSAVPEPQLFWLMFAGLGAVGWAARDRRLKSR